MWGGGGGQKEVPGREIRVLLEAPVLVAREVSGIGRILDPINCKSNPYPHFNPVRICIGIQAYKNFCNNAGTLLLCAVKEIFFL
jgi:hypothetical protein